MDEVQVRQRWRCDQQGAFWAKFHFCYTYCTVFKIFKQTETFLFLSSCTSRLEWPKDQYFPPCVLTFRDGWEPPALPTPARERKLAQLAESLTSVGIQRQDDQSTRLFQEVRVSLTQIKQHLDVSCFFMFHLAAVSLSVQQGAPQAFSSTDGYDFSNSFKHRQFLDQDTAVAAFKHALSRRVDR